MIAAEMREADHMVRSAGLTPSEAAPDVGYADDESAIRGAVNARKATLRIERQAKSELESEGSASAPESVSGADFLAEPDEETDWRIHGLWPAGGNVLLAAQAKAGKTTLSGNLLRSLCDGDLFLGKYHVETPAGRVFVVDVEMSRNQARQWARAQGIRKADGFEYQPLRGAASAFNITVPGVRRNWAHRIRECGASIVVIDPLGPILGAIGLDENSAADVGLFLDGALGQLLTESGATEAVVVHHMGHAGERSKGSSRLRGWPDAEWFLVRQDESPSSPRYFSAYGRDVEEAESLLGFDPVTRSLTLAGGTRAQSRARTAACSALPDLVAVVTQQPGIVTRSLESALRDRGHSLDASRAVIQEAVESKVVRREPGPHRAQMHYVAVASDDVQEALSA